MRRQACALNSTSAAVGVSCGACAGRSAKHDGAQFTAWWSWLLAAATTDGALLSGPVGLGGLVVEPHDQRRSLLSGRVFLPPKLLALLAQISMFRRFDVTPLHTACNVGPGRQWRIAAISSLEV